MLNYFKENILTPTNEMCKLAGLKEINMDSNYPPNMSYLDTGIDDTDEDDEEDGESEMTCGSMDRF